MKTEKTISDFIPNGKIIVISAPSGTGKSTLISRIINDPCFNLRFSVSATSRKPRGEEKNGKDYYFITADEFRRRIAADEFVEWEEVYADTYYGTLVSEIKRITNEGANVIMDIDVKGGLNVKRRFGDNTICIFIMPPSIDELRKRLENRATDSPEKIEQRVAKAEEEIGYSQKFDCIIVNDVLDNAEKELRATISTFLGK